MKNSTRFLLAAVMALCWSNASASVAWTFGGSSSNLSDTNYSKTVDGIELKITAWANTNGTDGGLSSEFQLKDLRQYSGGLGIISNSSGSPQHAIGDSLTEEFLLLEFSESVAIDRIGNGWWSGDSDASVLAYTGGPLPSGADGVHPDGFQRGDMTSLNSNPADNCCFDLGLTQAGWTLLTPSSTTDIGSGRNINGGPGQLFSNYWLIGNVNEHMTSGISTNNDFFKLNLISAVSEPPCIPGTPGCGGGSSAPTPSTVVLLGLGLLLLRRKKSL